MNDVDSRPQSNQNDQINGSVDNSYQYTEPGFDLGAIVSAFYRSRFWIVGIFILTLLVGIAVSLLVAPVFRSVATVQIEQEAQKVIGTEDSNAAASVFDSERFLQTQLDIVRSRSLAETVAEDLDLLQNSSYMEAVGLNLSDIPIRNLSLEETHQDQVINSLQENLGASLPLDSRLASISFEARDPVIAAEIANSFAENYIKSNLERKFETSSYAREFLKQQLDEAAGQLADDEREALSYAASSQIIDVSDGSSQAGADSGPRSLSTATLLRLNDQFSDATSRRIAAEQKWRSARNASAKNLSSILDNSAIQRLQEERAKVEAEYKDQLAVRKDDFPTVKRTKARLDELNQQISEIANSVKSSIKNEYDAARLEEAAFKKKIEQLKSSTLKEQAQAVRLGILQRQARTTQELYDLLLTRYNELNAQSGVQTNNLAIVDKAIPPMKPFSPNIPLNLALSLIAGFVFSTMFVFAREQLFDVVRLPTDVEDKLGFPLIGAIPLTSTDQENLVMELSDLKSQISEAYSSVRTSLLLSSATGLPKSLMFTSTSKSEGKSTSCFALAVSLARVGKKVLVIDMDLRRPQQHRNFEVSNSVGMSEVLSQNEEFQNVVIKTSIEGLDFVSSGAVPPNPTELMSAKSTGDFFQSMESRYDIVLADCTPVMGLADSLLISSHVEKAIFVVESGRTQTPIVKQAIKRFSANGVSILGVLLTKFNSKDAGYGNSGYYEYSYRE